MRISTPLIFLIILLCFCMCSCAPPSYTLGNVNRGTIQNGVTIYHYNGCDYLIASFASGVSITATANQPSTCKDY